MEGAPDLRKLSRGAFAESDTATDVSACRVRCVDGEEKLTISFVHNGFERVLVRKPDESLDSTFARMKKSLAGKKGKGDGSTDEVWLEDDVGVSVPPSHSNREAWQPTNILHVGDHAWVISRNEPTVSVLQLKQPLVVGFAALPAFNHEFAEVVVFRWQRGHVDGTWDIVQEGPQSYTPTNADIGKRLKVQAVAVRIVKSPNQIVVGPAVECEISGFVIDSPRLSMHSERLMHIKKWDACERDNRYRVATYNLLADNTPAARNGRYVFCAPHVLDIHYRKQLLTWELLQYDADVICLQEVTPSAYESYMAPQLAAAGWAGSRVDKNFTTSMACVVLYKTSKFRLGSEHRVDLHREWRELGADEFPQVSSNHPGWLQSPFASVSIPPQLEKSLDTSSAVGQIVALYPEAPAFTDAQPFFVLNAHVMGHPKDVLGRMIQVATILRKTKAVMMEQYGLSDAAILFGGDFNSTSEEACHTLLSEGKLPQSHPVWREAHALFPTDAAQGPDVQESKSGRRDEEVGVDVESGWTFERGATHVKRSYIDPKHFEPETYRDECLVDFIYFNSFLCTAPGGGGFPNVREDDIRADTAIPSASFGSDHVAVLHELQMASGL